MAVVNDTYKMNPSEEKNGYTLHLKQRKLLRVVKDHNIPIKKKIIKECHNCSHFLSITIGNKVHVSLAQDLLHIIIDFLNLTCLITGYLLRAARYHEEIFSITERSLERKNALLKYLPGVRKFRIANLLFLSTRSSRDVGLSLRSNLGFSNPLQYL